MKSFKKALLNSYPAVIAEIKRKSPSKGDLAEIRDPVSLAQAYMTGGAAAISVLTNAEGFKGSLQDLQAVSAALQNTPVPILRKDFILEASQVEESLAYGANVILLIVSVLKEKTHDLLKLARSIGLEVLVEVHTREELIYALSIDADIIGVNNRNLQTFEINPEQAIELKPHIPASVLSIAESGIRSVSDAQKYLSVGYQGLLIGEALVKSKNPAQLIRDIRALK